MNVRETRIEDEIEYVDTTDINFKDTETDILGKGENNGTVLNAALHAKQKERRLGQRGREYSHSLDMLKKEQWSTCSNWKVVERRGMHEF